MPEQILLQGKILGTEEFLLAGTAEGRSVRSAAVRSAGEDLLAGKSQWITLLGEVLPRALLAELQAIIADPEKHHAYVRRASMIDGLRMAAAIE